MWEQREEARAPAVMKGAEGLMPSLPDVPNGTVQKNS